jgi:hypothetical protein
MGFASPQGAAVLYTATRFRVWPKAKNNRPFVAGLCLVAKSPPLTQYVLSIGPVGVELAAELISAYPDKSITIVANKPTLLNKHYGAHAVKACHEFFTQKGVELILCDTAEIVRYSRVQTMFLV